jgi:hypothetical protein
MLLFPCCYLHVAPWLDEVDGSPLAFSRSAFLQCLRDWPPLYFSSCDVIEHFRPGNRSSVKVTNCVLHACIVACAPKLFHVHPHQQNPKQMQFPITSRAGSSADMRTKHTGPKIATSLSRTCISRCLWVHRIKSYERRHAHVVVSIPSI